MNAWFLVFAYMLFKSNWAQQKMIGKTSEFLTELLGTPVSLKEIDIDLLHGIVLEELYVESVESDTLAYIGKLSAGINYFDFEKDHLALRNVTLDRLTFRLKEDSAGYMNLMHIIDRFSSDSPDTTKSGGSFMLSCNSLQIIDSKFSYSTYAPKKLKHEINFEDLDLKKLNLNIKDIFLLDDSISAQINHIAFHEKSGFKLETLVGKLNLSGKGALFNDFSLKTKYSHAFLPKLHLNTSSWSSYGNFLNEVVLSLQFRRNSKLNFRDVNYFAGQIIPIKKPIRVSGKFDGPISSFSLSDFVVRFGKRGFMKVSGNSFGLPDAENTFWNLTVDGFRSSTEDLEYLLSDVTSLPSQLRRLGDISYDGKIVGMTFDMVADLLLSTDLGKVDLDVKLKKREDQAFEITGYTAVNRFNLGQLLQVENLGRIELKDTLKFVAFQHGGFYLDNSGKIDSVSFNNYTYRNIDLKGEFRNKNFSGKIKIKDENLDFVLSGLINLNDSVPKFSFAAKSNKIDFHAIHIDKTFKKSLLNFDLKTEFQGNHLDNILGEIRFDTICYQNDNGILPFDTLQLSVKEQENVKEMKILTDYFRVFVNGDFNFGTIDKTATAIAYNFFPIIEKSNFKGLEKGLISENVLIDKKYNQLDTLQNFTLDIELERLNKIVQIFVPDMHIADNTRCNGFLNSTQQTMRLTIESDSLGVGSQYIANPRISMDMYQSALISNITAKNIYISKDFMFRNFITRISAEALDNRLSMNVGWNNRLDTLNFAGNIFVDFEALKSYETGNINFITHLNQASVQIDSDHWMFDESQVVIDTTSIWFDNLRFASKDQVVALNGKITELPEDKLFLNVNKLNLSVLDPLTTEYSMKLGGIMSGEVVLTDVLKNMTINTTDSVIGFTLNDEKLGDLYFSTDYDNAEKTFNVDMNLLSHRFNQDILKVKGTVKPIDKKLDLDIDLNKFALKPFSPFVEGIVSDLEGSVSGVVKLDGTFSDPKIDGQFGLKRAKATLDYLQTRYQIEEDKIFLDNKRIQFSNATVRDPRMQRAKLDVLVTHNFFDDILLNIKLDARNFQVLNTTEYDNDLFYGTAFITGDMKISGPVDKMEFVVQAKSEQNTNINIPLSSSGSVESFDFIQFDETFGKKQEQEADDYEVDLSGIKLKLSLDVTPDAEMQLIMDKKVGDIIRAKGDGSITIDIDTKGDFFMYGDYVIEEGDYLFTLKNLINKKFEVNKGGTIRWNGDPFGADLDLQTIYKLRKIPLKDLDQDAYGDAKANVNCGLLLKGKLEQPSVSFNLDILNDQYRINEVFQKLTEEEMNKQFLSLLVMNRFQALYGGYNQALNSGNSDLISSNATELLSNQLSVWLSQMSDAFDMDVKWKQGDEQTQSEIEVGLSTEILNDRLSIEVSGNLNVGDKQNQVVNKEQQEFAGDYELSYKLTKNGKTRLKYYGRANQIISNKNIPFMQGMGILYREDFDTFRQLFKRYGDALFNRKEENEEEKKKEKDEKDK